MMSIYKYIEISELFVMFSYSQWYSIYNYTLSTCLPPPGPRPRPLTPSHPTSSPHISMIRVVFSEGNLLLCFFVTVQFHCDSNISP